MKKIETIKSVALIVLFFTTMLFLYSFWYTPIDKGFNFGGFIGKDNIDVPAIESVIVPRLVSLNSGEGTFSIVEENKGDKWFLVTREMADRNNAIESIDEISKTQFDLIMENRSITFNFNYGLPVDTLFQIYGIAENQALEQLGEISLLAYSSGSRESLFAYSPYKNKYYRLVYKNDFDRFDEDLREIAGRTNYNFYKIGHAIGTSNETIVPVSGRFSTEELVFTSEFSDMDEIDKMDFAKNFFGESLDFVRQIKGSKGSLTFMYGYGERILNISSKGKVDYRNSENPQGFTQGYAEALKTALNYVAYHGGWKNSKGIEMRPYVRRVEPIETDRQKGHRIIFGMDFGKDALYLSEGASIAVEVINGTIVRYQRDMINIDEEYYYANIFKEESEIFSVVNALASNYIEVAKDMKSIDIEADGIEGEDIFIAISDKIVYARNGYLKQDGEGESGKLKPAWVVNIGEGYIFFDLFTGEYLGIREF